MKQVPAPPRPPHSLSAPPPALRVRFRYRGVATDGLPEWMALCAPGRPPRPLTTAAARAFMTRDRSGD